MNDKGLLPARSFTQGNQEVPLDHRATEKS